MKYLCKSFSVPPPSQQYRDNWDAVFGDKKSSDKTCDGECNQHCLKCEFCSGTVFYGQLTNRWRHCGEIFHKAYDHHAYPAGEF